MLYREWAYYWAYLALPDIAPVTEVTRGLQDTAGSKAKATTDDGIA
jgi:hypothetical protein